MSEETLRQEVLALVEKETGYSDQIQSLTISMIDMDEERFEKIISTSILRYGFEHTMINCIYPFLHKIGFLWQTGAVCPAQEHFMSNLIRQKLIVAIDGQIVRNTYKHKYLLFLPEGELHEISLLFANYLIRSRQHKAVYLGQSVPFSDLRSVYDIHKPDFLLTAVTSVPGPEEVQAYIDKLSEAFPQTRILISGFQVVSKRLTVPANVSIIAQISELLKVLGEDHI
jgi:methanogenic corrinoid protein MtbC1